jgi:hypothetical protein
MSLIPFYEQTLIQLQRNYETKQLAVYKSLSARCAKRGLFLLEKWTWK